MNYKDLHTTIGVINKMAWSALDNVKWNVTYQEANVVSYAAAWFAIEDATRNITENAMFDFLNEI